MLRLSAEVFSPSWVVTKFCNDPGKAEVGTVAKAGKEMFNVYLTLCSAELRGAAGVNYGNYRDISAPSSFV